ncbi:hypothetical protein Q7P37_000857 [Cladosporium fusiforme]
MRRAGGVLIQTITEQALSIYEPDSPTTTTPNPQPCQTPHQPPSSSSEPANSARKSYTASTPTPPSTARKSPSSSAPSTLSTTKPTKLASLQTHPSASPALLAADIATSSVSSLATLFAPFDTIISCTGMSLPRGSQLKITRAVLAAAASSNDNSNVVRHYIPWQFGLDYDAIGPASSQDLFDEQLAVRAELRAQARVRWTIVSTGMFMSFLFGAAFGVVDFVGGRVLALGGWGNALTVTAVEDIGRVVAELVLGGKEEGSESESGVVFVAGDTVCMRRLADVVDGLLGPGREVERRVKTVGELEAELAEVPGDAMRKYRAVFAAGVGVSWDKETSYNVRKGIETVLVEDWARENVKVPA